MKGASARKKAEAGKGSRPSSRERWMLVGAKRGDLIGAEYIVLDNVEAKP